MSSISLKNACKRYPRSLTGWSALHRLWELFQPATSLDRVTESDLRDARFLGALKGIDLEVERGEVAGLIGANGRRKFSLLKLVAALTLPAAGVGAAARRVGTLIEIEAGFEPEMSGGEN